MILSLASSFLQFPLVLSYPPPLPTFCMFQNPQREKKRVFIYLHTYRTFHPKEIVSHELTNHKNSIYIAKIQHIYPHKKNPRIDNDLFITALVAPHIRDLGAHLEHTNFTGNNLFPIEIGLGGTVFQTPPKTTKCCMV